jgi:hypothetical protein
VALRRLVLGSFGIKPEAGHDEFMELGVVNVLLDPVDPEVWLGIRIGPFLIADAKGAVDPRPALMPRRIVTSCVLGVATCTTKCWRSRSPTMRKKKTCDTPGCRERTWIRTRYMEAGASWVHYCRTHWETQSNSRHVRHLQAAGKTNQ